VQKSSAPHVGPCTEQSIYVTPVGYVHGSLLGSAVQLDAAMELVGAGTFFTALEVAVRKNGTTQFNVVPTALLHEWVGSLSAETKKNIQTRTSILCTPRRPFAGLSLDRTKIMGVINVTPDSFSDGGKFISPEKAIEHGLQLLEAGADILDVGGESTRPGAKPVRPDREIQLTEPVVRALAAQGALVSIDTRHAEVMSAALAAGACIVNDVTALSGDSRSLAIIKESNASVILMHMQGDPQTMQRNPEYGWVPGDVFDYLEARVGICAAAGIDLNRLCVDPGIGFGKSDSHNAEALSHLGMLHGLGCAVVVGGSRKSFISRTSNNEGINERLPGSVAIGLEAVRQGVQIIRTHDVKETLQAFKVQHRVLTGR